MTKTSMRFGRGQRGNSNLIHLFILSALYHLHTLYLFNCNDIDIIIMGLCFAAMNASIAPDVSMGQRISFTDILRSTPKSVLWSWSNLFLFQLQNQRDANAMAEDRANKPWRPIASGRITSGQATLLMHLTYPTVIVIAWTVGGLAPCIIQTAFSLWYNKYGGGANPVLKSLLTAIGLTVLVCGPLEITTQHAVFGGEGKMTAWLLIIVAALATTAHAQDFRDMEGDKAAGRRTIPLVIGDFHARMAVAIGLFIWTPTACYFWDAELRHGMVTYISAALVAGNLLRHRTRKGDVVSYRLYPCWMVGLFVLPYLKTNL
ncbi:UbiA prenyltransferase family-domain-containing protein [Xylaria cf. heliscus]|nr:UbiA prenyltransferase family-domain-containing protein [Xylaria cf. heliscus]